MVDLPVGGISVALVRHGLSRFSRRGDARRELEQVRGEIERCAAMFVALTQGGTIQFDRLPTQSQKSLAPLHAEGFLTDVEFEALQMLYSPAEQANLWLAAPEQSGPAGENTSRRLSFLLLGRKYVEWRDPDGNTLLDLAHAAIAGALTAIEKPWWKVL